MKLKDIYKDAKTGLDAIKRAPILDYETDLKCIRIGDISQGRGFDDRGFTETSESDYKKFKLNKDDILIARTGATVGVSCIIKDDYNAVFNNGMIRLHLKDGINPFFVYYLFQTKEFKQFIDNVSCVSTQPNLKIENLLRFEFSDLGEEEQNKLVKILSKYDELIENNNKRIKILEEISKEIYKERFLRFRFPGYKNHELTNGIPEGWKYEKFSEVCSFIRGVSYSSDQIDIGDAPNLLINLKNIKDFGGFRKENYKTYDGKYKQDQVVKKFDLVMAVTEMVQERRIIGYVGLVPSYNINCVISADLIKINSELDNIFLYSMFTYGGASACFSQYGNGTNVIHLKPSSLKNVKLLIPNSELIDKYVTIVKNHFEEIDYLELQNEKLNIQRNYLLPRLMSGKLEVK